MHRVFQAFIDGLVASGDTERLRTVLADAGAALDLSCFAYLSMPSRRGDPPELISNYPVEWPSPEGDEPPSRGRPFGLFHPS